MKAIFLAFSAVLIVGTFHIAAAKAQIVVKPPHVELGDHHRDHDRDHSYRHEDRDHDDWRHHRHHDHDDDDED
jgi:hypothetical protein